MAPSTKTPPDNPTIGTVERFDICVNPACYEFHVTVGCSTFRGYRHEFQPAILAAFTKCCDVEIHYEEIEDSAGEQNEGDGCFWKITRVVVPPRDDYKDKGT